MTNPRALALCLAACFLLLKACGTDKPVDKSDYPPTGEARPLASQATMRSWSVVRTLPHDSMAFTQGLIVRDGVIFESTGQYGQSSVRRVSIATGKVQRRVAMDPMVFGEGMTELNGILYVLTWQNQKGYKLDARTLETIGDFSYTGEGWGLTTDGTSLYMSNGSDMIAVYREGSFVFERFISVTINGSPLRNLNELEWIDGAIWANVWQTDQIVRIDPSTGAVTDIVDLAALYPAAKRGPFTDVLNGIAYDRASKAMYVTGKNWPLMYQIAIH